MPIEQCQCLCSFPLSFWFYPELGWPFSDAFFLCKDLLLKALDEQWGFQPCENLPPGLFYFKVIVINGHCEFFSFCFSKQSSMLFKINHLFLLGLELWSFFSCARGYQFWNLLCPYCLPSNDNCGSHLCSLTQGVWRVCMTASLYSYWLPGILLGDLTLFFTRKPNTAKDL